MNLTSHLCFQLCSAKLAVCLVGRQAASSGQSGPGGEQSEPASLCASVGCRGAGSKIETSLGQKATQAIANLSDLQVKMRSVPLF